MSKDAINQYDATAANNTDVGGISIDEGMLPSSVNNALREIMSHLKDVDAGTSSLTSPVISGNVGIGTTSPSTSLDVVRAGVQPLRVESSSGTEVAINMVNTGGNVQLEAHSGNFNIDAGAVGIGTSTISGKLTLAGDDAFEAITLRDNTSSANMFSITCAEYSGSGGNPNKFTAINSSAISFELGGSERARIDSSGNVMVGGTTYGGAGLSLAKPDSSGVFSIFTGGGTGFQMRFGNVTNGVVGSITSTTSATAFNTSSDYRLKENITDITDGITRLKLLNPSRFNFIANADTTVDGFLAHEVSDVVPEAIVGEKDAMMDEEYIATPATGEIYTPAQEATFDDGNELTAAVDEIVHSTDVEQPDTLEEGRQWRETTAAVMATRSVPDYQGIDQSKLVPLLTAALQEAVAEIEALKTRVAALEG